MRGVVDVGVVVVGGSSGVLADGALVCTPPGRVARVCGGWSCGRRAGVWRLFGRGVAGVGAGCGRRGRTVALLLGGLLVVVSFAGAPAQADTIVRESLSPYGVAVDGSGDVFIADTSNRRVVKDAPDGAGGYTETVVASNLIRPVGVAVDGSGDVFIADSFNDRVVKETPGGVGGYTETVVASNLIRPVGVAVDGSGDVFIADTGNSRVVKDTPGGAGGYTQTVVDSSNLNGPQGVAVDGSGDVFIADTGNSRVVKDAPDGTGGYTQTVVDTLDQPLGVAVDGSGDVFIADSGNGRVVEDTPDGTGGYTQTVVAQSLYFPHGVAVDGSGDVFIADTGNSRVVKDAPDGTGGYTQTVVGPGLSYPQGVAVDGSGDVFIADSGNSRVVKETPAASGGYTQTVVASSLYYPYGVAVDGSGDVFIADTGNSRVVKETPGGADGYTQTVVDLGLSHPWGVAVDGSGDVFIADTFSNRVVKDAPDGAGGYTETVVDSNLTEPFGVAVDGSGDVFIADTYSNRVVKDTPDGVGGYTQTVVDSNLNGPQGVAVDGSGDVFIADTGNSRVVKDAPDGAGGYTQTVVDTLDQPLGVAVDGSGDVFIAHVGGVVEHAVVGPASGASSTITASPGSIPADGSSAATITVTAKDANGNQETTGGDRVVVSTTVGALSSVTDNGDGTYTATLTGTTVGQADVSATIDGQPITTGDAMVSFVPGPASGASSTITASPGSIPADGSSAATITVTAKDANGNQETTGGDRVVVSTTVGALSSVTDKGDGTYTATLTATTVGTADVSATIDGQPITTGDAMVAFVGKVRVSMVVVKTVDPPGPRVFGAAVDPATSTVYVADGLNSVLSYSADLGTRNPDIFTGSGPEPPEPIAVAVDPRAGSHRLFVALYGGGLDHAQNSGVDVIPLEPGPTACSVGGFGAGVNGVAFNPNTEKLYASAAAAPSVAVAAGPGNCALTADVPVDDKPASVAVDVAANRVYAPIHTDNELAVIDGGTDALSQIPVLAGNPSGIAADGVNHRVYLAENIGNRIVDVDSGPHGTGPYTQTNLTVGDGPASVAVDPALDRAYVGVVNFEQLAVVEHDVVQPAPVNLGFVPSAVAVDPVDHCVYVSGYALTASGTQAKLARVCDSIPSIISSASDSEKVGVPFSFTVKAIGYPTAMLTKAGALPKGVTFTNNRNGTATISGTAAVAGAYTLTITAKNSAGSAPQTFTLTVSGAPTINTIPATTGHVGSPLSLTIRTKGYPPPTLTETGTLPDGLAFVDNANGTATISGVPAIGSGGARTITITATNPLGTATKSFTLKIDEAPAITSAATATARTGVPFSFTVTATGYPAPKLTKTGVLPTGVTFTAASGKFSGMPKAGTAGTYPITITATNNAGAATQQFNLVVQ